MLTTIHDLSIHKIACLLIYKRMKRCSLSKKTTRFNPPKIGEENIFDLIDKLSPEEIVALKFGNTNWQHLNIIISNETDIKLLKTTINNRFTIIKAKQMDAYGRILCEMGRLRIESLILRGNYELHYFACLKKSDKKICRANMVMLLSVLEENNITYAEYIYCVDREFRLFVRDENCKISPTKIFSNHKAIPLIQRQINCGFDRVKCFQELLEYHVRLDVEYIMNIVMV